MAGSHGGFSCILCEFGPRLRTNHECYLLLLEMLVAVVGAGDRALSSCAAAHVKKRFDLAFADSIPYTRETNSDSISLNHFCRNRSAKLLRYEWEKDKGRGAEMSCLFTDPVASERTVI